MSLIFSRSTFDRALTLPEIEMRAPAVFAETAADKLSSRYGQVTTATAIDILGGFGFRPVQAAQKRSRTASGMQHAEHLLAFSRDTNGGGDGRGEVVLYNSHDGTSALKLFAGFYRFICSNGMIAGEGFSTKLRHTAGTVSGFERMVYEIAGSLPELMDRIRRMQSVQVDRAAAYDLAREAASLRWDPLADAARDPETGRVINGAYFTPRTVEQILTPRRRADAGDDLWSVFNRVQESVIRGGVDIRSITDRTGAGGSDRRARAVDSVRGSVDLNRNLWDLAEQVAA